MRRYLNVPLVLLVVGLALTCARAVTAYATSDTPPQVTNVEVSAQSLNEAMQRIDSTLANCTGVFRYGGHGGVDLKAVCPCTAS